MPGFGKSGTSRISFLRFSINDFIGKYASVFDTKSRICVIRLENYFFHFFDTRKARARVQVMFERLYGTFRALGKRFHASVGQVSNIAADLVTRRRTLGEIPVTDTLDQTANKKLPSN